MKVSEAIIAAQTHEDVFYEGNAGTINDLDVDGEGIPAAYVTGQYVGGWIPISELELGRDSIARASKDGRNER